MKIQELSGTSTLFTNAQITSWFEVDYSSSHPNCNLQNWQLFADAALTTPFVGPGVVQMSNDLSINHAVVSDVTLFLKLNGRGNAWSSI